jgi:hypothetical protein
MPQGDFITLRLEDLLPAFTKHLHSMPHSVKPRKAERTVASSGSVFKRRNP